MEQNYAQLRQSWPKIRTQSTQIDFPLPPLCQCWSNDTVRSFQHPTLTQGGRGKSETYFRFKGGDGGLGGVIGS